MNPSPNDRELTPDEKRELLRLIEEKKKYQKDTILKNMTFGLIQKEYLLCGTKIALLLGANRSGKSEVLSCDFLIRMTGVIPDSLAEEYPKEFIRTGEYWTACEDFNSITDIIKKKFDRMGPARYNGGYHGELKRQLWKSPAGESEQRYKSYDAGRKKFQGTSKLGVSFDEEPPEDVYKESYMRTVDCSGILRLGYTPLQGMSWGHGKLWKKAGRYIKTENIHGIEEDIGIIHNREDIPKLKERRLIIQDNPSPDADPDITVFQMTIYDNIHLPDVEIWKAEKEYSEDPTNYNARILGGFTKITGANVYPAKMLEQRAKELSNKKFYRGDIDDDLRWVPSTKGSLILFEKPEALRNRLFVIGADIAEGEEGGDYSCAQILDHISGEQVGLWWGHVAPDEFASILYKLGRYFNTAWLAPERNFHGFQVVSMLKTDLHYPRLFGEYLDENTPEGGNSKQKKWGFLSTGQNKEITVKDLKQAIQQKRIILNDLNTIDELITVVYHTNRSIGAMRGCNDDRERALAIAWHVWLNRKPKAYTGHIRRINLKKPLSEVRQYGRT